MRIDVIHALGIADPHGLEHLERAPRGSCRTRPSAPGRSRRSGRRRSSPGSARTSDPAGPSRCAARGCRCIARSVAARRSSPAKEIRRAVTRAGRRDEAQDRAPGHRLPEPDSPTMPEPLAADRRSSRRARPRRRPRGPGSGPARSSTMRIGVIAGARSSDLRIEDVAQPVAQQVEAEADDEDREARESWPPTTGRGGTAGRTRSSRPTRAAGGCAPRPRKPRPAAVRMMPAMSSVDAHDHRGQCRAARRGRSTIREGDGALEADRRDEVAVGGWSGSPPGRCARRAATR